MFKEDGSATATLDPPETGFSLEVGNVTGSRSFMAEDIDPADSAGNVAQALAAELSLPRNVTWVLRDDTSSAFLDGDQAIGDQVKTGSKVSLTPRAHLG